MMQLLTRHQLRRCVRDLIDPHLDFIPPVKPSIDADQARFQTLRMCLDPNPHEAYILITMQPAYPSLLWTPSH